MEPVFTNRLTLRRFAVADLTDLRAFRSAPDVLRFVNEEPMTAAGATQFLEKQASLSFGDARGYFAFAVEHRGEQKVIGEMGVFLHPEAQSRGDIGWIIHPDYQRCGYATEAAHALLSLCFTAGGLHRVTAGCDARNAASVRVMERLEMRREGHLVQSHFSDGAWQDEYLYGLLREEWAARQGRTNE